MKTRFEESVSAPRPGARLFRSAFIHVLAPPLPPGHLSINVISDSWLVSRRPIGGGSLHLRQPRPRLGRQRPAAPRSPQAHRTVRSPGKQCRLLRWRCAPEQQEWGAQRWIGAQEKNFGAA